MARVRVHILGPVVVTIDDVAVKLIPRDLKVLMRLVAAAGEPVSVHRLLDDLWPTAASLRKGRTERNQVQKSVSALRKAFDPGGIEESSSLLHTERLLNGHEPQTAYRLVLDADTLDGAEFSALVNEAMYRPPASAAEQLTRAVALWRGRPFADAGESAYALSPRKQWQDLYATALRELVRVHVRLLRHDLALPVAERFLAEYPDDTEAAAELARVRNHLRDQHGAEIFRCELPALNSSIAIVQGDLFDQDDANLVVGFSDTFDIDTKHNLVINSVSVQGQLLHRLYGGDIAALDRELRRGLRNTDPVFRETMQTKEHGKRLRYPIGTVVAMPQGDRRIFAAAYSSLGNDLIARARPEDLALTLDRLWESAARNGAMKAVAIPLVGSGLSRITDFRSDLGTEELIHLIVESFLRACRTHSTVSRQLRIVLRPAHLKSADMAQVARAIGSMCG
jgi:DNA-binding SARP family transcriptional activator